MFVVSENTGLQSIQPRSLDKNELVTQAMSGFHMMTHLCLVIAWPAEKFPVFPVEGSIN